MKDEIKEILDKFDKVLENYELDKKFGQMSVDSICHLFPSEMVAIKDYITNLQDKYERMKENAKILSNGYDDLEKRNEKIIRKISLYRMDDITMESNRILNDLLNVALGEDKDVKDKR